MPSIAESEAPTIEMPPNATAHSTTPPQEEVAVDAAPTLTTAAEVVQLDEAAPTRLISQTDRLNKQLLQSLLKRMQSIETDAAAEQQQDDEQGTDAADWS